MKDNVPSGTDRNKAVSDVPPMLDEILDLAPALEAEWPAIRATIPTGTPVNDGGEGEGEGSGGEPNGEPSGEPEGGNQEEFFVDSFNLDNVPPEARPHVEALQKEWQGEYTKRRQAEAAEIAEAKREAEQSQALIEGLRDPATARHYWSLMGIDLSDPEVLESLGISAPGEQVDKELLDLLDDDETAVESRLEKIEREREEEVQAKKESAMEQALDDLADQQLEKIEQAWGRELDEDEDFFIRSRAEANPGPDGLPDYESAAALLKGFLGRREQEFAQKRSEPGRGAPGGKPGGKALDPNNEEDRLALAAAAAEREMASQQ